jgi:hypothetical protein
VDDVPPGRHALHIVARDPRRPHAQRAERVILRSPLIAFGGSGRTCHVHVVNSGVELEGNRLTVHFMSTGSPGPTGFLCSLDRSALVECK